MKTRITELLGTEYPIIQGGMAWVAEQHLAAAVSNAGGLGVIGGANAPGEVVRDMIRKCREMTDKPFGVNVMLMSPYAPDVARVVVEEGVKVVFPGAGNPGQYIDMWKQAGIKVIPVVASVALAKIMEKAGVDAVVAEGTESGGHIGEATTMTLVPQVVDAVKIPVIAAGGIADGRRSHGHPVRGLRNQMTREYLKLESEGRPFEELEHLTLGALRRAVQDGDVKNGTVMAGQIAGLIHDIESCEEIVHGMADECEKLLNKKWS